MIRLLHVPLLSGLGFLVRTSNSITWWRLNTLFPSFLWVGRVAPKSTIIFCVRILAIIIFLFFGAVNFFVRRILRPLLALLSTFGLCIYRAFLFELQQFWIIFSFAIITWGWLVTSLPPCIRVSGIAPQPFIIFVRVPAIVMIFVLWTVNFFVRRILRPLLALLSTYRKLKLWVFALPF